MKYLVAIDGHFSDRAGGSARVAGDIANLMRSRGHSVAYVSMQLDPAVQESTLAERDGTRIVRYAMPPTPPWHPRRAARRIAAAAAAVRRFYGDETWDLAHLHSALTGCGVIAGLGARTNYITTNHSPVTMEQRINWRHQGLLGQFKLAFGLRSLRELEQRLLSASRNVHVLSEYNRRQLQREHKLSTPIHVIPHWRKPELRRTLTRPEARRRLGWPNDRPVVFTVRRHVERMGLAVAIRALAPLAKQGKLLFVVGGEGPLRPKLQGLAATLGADAESIRFPGLLSDSQLLLAYQAADLFVLPTLELECFGLITLEALSFGCPVIGTDAGATPELLDPLAPGLIVPASSVGALRRKVEDFLAGRLAIPSEEEIVAYVARRYDPDVVTPRLLALLEGSAVSRAAAAG